MERALDRVATDVTSHAWDALDPVRVATDGRKTGDKLGLGVEKRVVKRLLRGPIEREIAWLRRAWTEQYHVLLDGVAAGEPTHDEARERFVASDPFLDHYEGSDRDGFADALRGHHDRLTDAIGPVVAADRETVGAPDEPGFWEVAVSVYDEDEARELLERLTGHAAILAEYRDGIAFEMGIEAPVVSEQTVGYGDEAVRVIREGIAAVRREEGRRMARALDGG